MKEPIQIVVYSDYLCPWCYIAAIRLHELEKEYGDKINICWKSYPLVRQEIRDRLISSHSIDSRYRAALEEDKIGFNPWNPDKPYPSSSMPALQAAKCARLQGEEAFHKFHIALFKAFFIDGLNISERDILISIARNTGLDIKKFRSDLSRKSFEKEVLDEFEEARAEYEGWGIPIVVVGGRYPITGAVPVALYRRAIDLCLASEVK